MESSATEAVDSFRGSMIHEGWQREGKFGRAGLRHICVSRGKTQWDIKEAVVTLKKQSSQGQRSKD
jgi:hypothetical protein